MLLRKVAKSGVTVREEENKGRSGKIEEWVVLPFCLNGEGFEAFLEFKGQHGRAGNCFGSYPSLRPKSKVTA